MRADVRAAAPTACGVHVVDNSIWQLWPAEKNIDEHIQAS